jgi:hypothetical protein
VTQQADKPCDIGRKFLLGNRKKIAKFLMRTFTCHSTFLYERIRQDLMKISAFLATEVTNLSLSQPIFHKIKKYRPGYDGMKKPTDATVPFTGYPDHSWVYSLKNISMLGSNLR